MAKKSQQSSNPAKATSSSAPTKTPAAKPGKSGLPSTKASTDTADAKRKGANKATKESSTSARASSSDRRAGAPSTSGNRPAADLNLALQQLRSHNVVGATHNSLDSGAQRCHDGTRVADQDGLFDWIRKAGNTKDQRRVQWVKGPAGSGKTAVLRSVAHRCQSAGLLAGSFTFSLVSPYANEKRKTNFFASLAYQFVVNDDMRDLRDPILSAIQRNPAVFKSALAIQVEELLLRPLRQVSSEQRSKWPKAIIIDNLDECMTPPPQGFKGKRRTDWNEQQEILNALLRALRDAAFPFCLVIGTRDDRNFRQFFTTTAARIASIFDWDEKEASASVELFLKAKFAQIRQRRHLDQAWPSSTLLSKLISGSHGGFIYPSTSIRYLENSPWDPPKQDPLSPALSASSKGAANSAKPLKELDDLYSLALGSGSPNSTQFVRLIWTTHLIQTGFFGELVTEHFTTAFLRQFVDPATNFDTVIGIFMESSSLIRIYHRSLLDFLGDQTRCGTLYVQEASRFSFVAVRYVEICKNKGPPKGSSIDQGAFLRMFLTLKPSFHLLTKPDYLSLERELLACDAEWWIKSHISHAESQRSASESSRQIISLMFRDVHREV